jgi:hypothetical protein
MLALGRMACQRTVALPKKSLRRQIRGDVDAPERPICAVSAVIGWERPAAQSGGSVRVDCSAAYALWPCLRGEPGTVCGRLALVRGCHGVTAIAMGPGLVPTGIGGPAVLVAVLIGVTVPEPALLT